MKPPSEPVYISQTNWVFGCGNLFIIVLIIFTAGVLVGKML